MKVTYQRCSLALALLAACSGGEGDADASEARGGLPAAGMSVAAPSGIADDTDPATGGMAGASGSAGVAAMQEGGGASVDAGADVGGSTGCGKRGSPTGLLARTMTLLGEERRYSVFVPETYDAEVPLALVFAWHGLGSTGAQIRLYSGLEAEAAGTAIFVYPEGTTQTTAVGTGSSWAEKDVLFFDGMYAAVAEEYCVAAGRVFSTGHSAGGWLSNTLACERGDVLAGVAPVSSGLLFAAGDLVFDAECVGRVASVVVNGVMDPIVAHSHGVTSQAWYARRNGCAETTMPVDPDPCVDRDGCEDGLPVRWCSHEESAFAGHGWPAWTARAIWSVLESL